MSEPVLPENVEVWYHVLLHFIGLPSFISAHNDGGVNSVADAVDGDYKAIRSASRMMVIRNSKLYVLRQMRMYHYFFIVFSMIFSSVVLQAFRMFSWVQTVGSSWFFTFWISWCIRKIFMQRPFQPLGLGIGHYLLKVMKREKRHGELQPDTTLSDTSCIAIAWDTVLPRPTM